MSRQDTQIQSQLEQEHPREFGESQGETVFASHCRKLLEDLFEARGCLEAAQDSLSNVGKKTQVANQDPVSEQAPVAVTGATAPKKAEAKKNAEQKGDSKEGAKDWQSRTKNSSGKAKEATER